MTNATKQIVKADISKKVKVGIKEKEVILNYGIIKTDRREKGKLEVQLKNEILPYFDKTNAHILAGVKHNGIVYEGFAQRIKKTSKRFDVSAFKVAYPKIYMKFLVEMPTLEIKVDYKVVSNDQ
jgi:hypothetical protein